MNEFDPAKLLNIARNLSDYGTSLSMRTSPPDADMYRALGQAFAEASEAIGDLTTELARRGR